MEGHPVDGQPRKPQDDRPAAFADTKLMVLLAASTAAVTSSITGLFRLKRLCLPRASPRPAGYGGAAGTAFLSLMRVTAGNDSADIYFQF